MDSELRTQCHTVYRARRAPGRWERVRSTAPLEPTSQLPGETSRSPRRQGRASLSVGSESTAPGPDAACRRLRVFIRPLPAAGWSDAKTLDTVALERDCSSFPGGDTTAHFPMFIPSFQKGLKVDRPLDFHKHDGRARDACWGVRTPHLSPGWGISVAPHCRGSRVEPTRLQRGPG